MTPWGMHDAKQEAKVWRSPHPGNRSCSSWPQPPPVWLQEASQASKKFPPPVCFLSQW